MRCNSPIAALVGVLLTATEMVIRLSGLMFGTLDLRLLVTGSMPSYEIARLFLR